MRAHWRMGSSALGPVIHTHTYLHIHMSHTHVTCAYTHWQDTDTHTYTHVHTHTYTLTSKAQIHTTYIRTQAHTQTRTTHIQRTHTHQWLWCHEAPALGRIPEQQVQMPELEAWRCTWKRGLLKVELRERAKEERHTHIWQTRCAFGGGDRWFRY